MFDNDLAWQQATQRALKLFYQQNLFPKIISLPEPWKDIDEISNEENWKDIFNECLSKAEDWFVELYNRLRKSSDMTSPIDKQKHTFWCNNLCKFVNNSRALQRHIS